MRIDASLIDRDWLSERLGSFDMAGAMRFELRKLGLADAQIEKLAANATPKFRAEWTELVAAAAPGDVLWYFRSPEATWRERAGRAGFAVVRDGVAVAALVTSLS